MKMETTKKVLEFTVEIPVQFTASTTSGMVKLSPEKVAETFVNNLKNLGDFYAGKSVKFSDLKYGRETEIKLGIEQIIANKGKAKLVGVKFAGHNVGEDDVMIMLNKNETACVNLTGLWKVGDGATFQYSIFAGKKAF